MRPDARLLVIGPSALGQAVSGAFPKNRSVTTDNLLAGVWTLGQGDFDGVVVSLGLGPEVASAVRNLRKVAPAARIIAAVEPSDEPAVGKVIEAGADDYVLEPVLREDLEEAFGMGLAMPGQPPGPFVPSIQELSELADLLRNLGDGTPATLQRIANLLRSAFGAHGAAVMVDDLSSSSGDAADPVLREPLYRQQTPVGNIALSRRESGTYSSADAARLGNYARLVETILAQAQTQAHWQELAWRDDLCGLHNRRYFDAALEDLVKRAADNRLRLTVVLFDIDDFKSYNDHYGHDTGDALIREVATLLTHCSREHDVVARYGGDEFAVVLWDSGKPRVAGSQHPTDPTALADRLRHAISRHAFKCLGPEAPGPVTISGGLACFPWDGRTPAEIVRAADEALLAAKRAGKNRIILAPGGANGSAGRTTPAPDHAA